MLWVRVKAVTRRLFRRSVVEQDLNDEIHAYLQEDIDIRTRSGLTPEAARREALVALGGSEQVKELVRDSRTAAWLDGVVADSRELDFSLAPETLPTFYLTNAQSDGATFLVRSAIDPGILTPVVRQQIAAVDKDMPLDNIQTVESLIQKSIAPDRYRTLLINIFAILAVGLALIGLYGVVSRTVVQRKCEISIRMALGARPGSVLWMVLRQSLQLTAAGIGIGVLGAMALTRTLSGFLFDIHSTDAATYVGVAIGLLVVALFSTYLPARRAARTDPMIALRAE